VEKTIAPYIKKLFKEKWRAPWWSALSLVYGGVIFIAEVGHCISQAKHWMQSGSLTGSDFFSEVGWPGASAQS
jgi:hypothetical protein